MEQRSGDSGWPQEVGHNTMSARERAADRVAELPPDSPILKQCRKWIQAIERSKGPVDAKVADGFAEWIKASPDHLRCYLRLAFLNDTLEGMGIIKPSGSPERGKT